MLRSSLIYLSKAAWAQKLITNWSFASRAASRFVPGEKTEDVIRAIRELNENGFNATLNHLGEHLSTADEAEKATDEILLVLNEIDKANLKSNVSIKLTQIGIGLDERICQQNLVQILTQVKKCNNFLRVDMEDTPYTDITISLYRSMLERGFNQRQLGLVLQAYLFRTEDDLRKLLKEGTRIRLVKGAYDEPPDKAYSKKADTDANYDLLTKIMIDAALEMEANSVSEDGHIPPFVAVASHDENRIAFAKQYAEKIGLPKAAIEFQMLYGIRRDLQNQLLKDGYPVRVYVPYGTQWYQYFMRRLAERPANIWFFISNYFRK
ncbi:MAG TPA: proline dehydrogenase family protein [Anaerolineales bacterium]|nr:proline dehydrogenase family protein [Anaerolineales bacterium]